MCVVDQLVHIGIDPGKKGYAAILTSSTQNCLLVLPIGSVADCLKLLQTIKTFDVSCLRIVIEKVPVYVKDIPSSTTFKLGYNFGLVCGLLLGSNIPFREVSPRVWMKEFSLIGAKDRKQKARDLVAKLLGKVVSCEQADSVLIAIWSSKHS